MRSVGWVLKNLESPHWRHLLFNNRNFIKTIYKREPKSIQTNKHWITKGNNKRDHVYSVFSYKILLWHFLEGLTKWSWWVFNHNFACMTWQNSSCHKHTVKKKQKPVWQTFCISGIILITGIRNIWVVNNDMCWKVWTVAKICCVRRTKRMV